MREHSPESHSQGVSGGVAPASGLAVEAVLFTAPHARPTQILAVHKTSMSRTAYLFRNGMYG